MKPISIELQAFGPFAGTEKVDFENLSRDGLFLIRGKTGSGKSMILDAICYALFGKSSGENRDNLADLRCNRCDPDTDTFVRFTFEEKGTVYVFERSMEKARTRFSNKVHAGYIRDDGNLEPLFENPKEKDVTKKAEEIIGLTFDQFRQVIILPQGKFEKLLTSRSDEKESILASIFGTEKWQKIADRYYDSAKTEKDRLDEIKKTIDSRLADEGCSNMDELREKVQSAVSSKEEEEKLFNEKNYDSVEKELNAQKVLCGEFRTLRNHMKRKDELDSRAQSIEADRQKLEAANKAEPFRKPLDEMVRNRESFNERKNDEDIAGILMRAAKENSEKAKQELQDHIETRKDYEAWKKECADLESKKPLYETLNDTLMAKSAAKDKHDSALKELELAQEEYDKRVAETDELYKSYEDAINTHKAGMDSYMNGIRGTMAAELEEGSPCPVCGSTTHPAKAIIPEGTVSMDYLDLLEQVENQKKDNWTHANENRMEYEKVLEEKKHEEMQLKSEYEMAAAEDIRIRENLIEGIENLDQLSQKMRELNNNIILFENDERKLEDKAQQMALVFKGEEAKWESASEEMKKAEELYLKSKEEWDKLISDSEFESAEDAKKFMLSDEERSRIMNETGEYDGQLKEIEKLISEMKEQLDGVEEPDMLQIDAQLENIGREKDAFNKSQGSFISEIERMNEKLSLLEKETGIFESEIQKAESNLLFAKSLRGDTGIGLQRYVLGIMFSSVIAAANEMLEKVHGGRYRLYRTDEKGAGSNKRGLDLKVHDSYSDGSEGRTVSTLSGGEKFLASLALSLGMSAVARSGGVHIEGMFIDEGFGTLDENSVEDALDVLKSIRQMNGSVGIISHMDVLGANIPSQLLVQKEKETSTIRLV